MCPFSALGPHLVQTHASPVYTASVREFIGALALLCFESLVSLVSSVALIFFPHRCLQDSLSPERRDVMETSLLGLNISRSLTHFSSASKSPGRI